MTYERVAFGDGKPKRRWRVHWYGPWYLSTAKGYEIWEPPNAVPTRSRHYRSFSNQKNAEKFLGQLQGDGRSENVRMQDRWA